MKTRCDDYIEGIAALATGEQNLAAEAHVATCEDCAQKLAQLKRVYERICMPSFDAPKELTDQVKLMMGPPRARLVASTLSLSGARSLNTEFQLMFEVEDASARLLYVPDGNAWRVMGEIEGGDWRPSRSGRFLHLDEDGRFTFRAPSLEQTDLLLRREDTEVLIPSAEELRKSGA